MVHKTKTTKTKTQNNMHWTALSQVNTNSINNTVLQSQYISKSFMLPYYIHIFVEVWQRFCYFPLVPSSITIICFPFIINCFRLAGLSYCWYWHMVHKTKTTKTKTQNNMHWTALSQVNTNSINNTVLQSQYISKTFSTKS
jgi:ribosomal protein L15E